MNSSASSSNSTATNGTATVAASTTPYPNLFQLYANAGSVPVLWLGLLPQTLIALLGVAFNTALVYATVTRRDKLNNACNILIALECAYCALSEASTLVSFVVPLSGVNYIPFRYCYFMLAVPSAAYVLSYGAMLSIALERLWATLFLFWGGCTKQISIVAMLTANGAFALYYGYKGLLNFLANPNNLVNCNTGDVFNIGSDYFFLWFSLGLTIGSFLCYCLIGLLLTSSSRKAKRQSSKADAYTRKVFRSLFVIMVMVVCSQIASGIWRLEKPKQGTVPALNTFLQEKIFYCLTYFANTANAPVLYLMSSDYNKAFKTLRPNVFAVFDRLQWLTKPDTSSVGAVNNNNKNNNVVVNLPAPVTVSRHLQTNTRVAQHGNAPN